MSIVGGLALSALVQSSTSFNKDKRSIDVNQNLSAVLEIIGNDIRQAGEGINEGNFPAIEFNVATASNDPTLVPGSSKIIVRKAVSPTLTLCQAIPANTIPTGTLIVADNTPATINSTNGQNCDIGTTTSQFFAARPGTFSTTIPSPASSALEPALPIAMRQARDYRCQLDDPSPTVAYSDSTQSIVDFCNTLPKETLRVAISDQNGHILILNQTDETVIATTAPVMQYGIAVNNTFSASDSAIVLNSINKAATYAVGNPIYIIEERTYTLIPDPNNSNSGILTLSINGSPPQRLIKGIASFNVAARLYSSALTQFSDLNDPSVQPLIQSVDATPATLVTSGAAKNSPPKTTLSVLASDICPDSPATPLPTTPLPSNPQYVCKFNYNAALTDNTMNWKTIAGVKVSLQAKYDGTGQNAVATTADLAKLRAQAEYFPRNVLSK